MSNGDQVATSEPGLRWVDAQSAADHVSFGSAPHEQLTIEQASRLLTLMHQQDRAELGYWMAYSMTGEPPTVKGQRRRRSSPDKPRSQ